jgi:hypothetical protein
MAASITYVWGYKPNGEAKVFALRYDEALPKDWSSDVMVIEKPEHRTGERLSLMAGDSVRSPVFVTPETKAQAAMLQIEEEEAELATALRYDENNHPVGAQDHDFDEIPRRRGRPPGSKNRAG